MKRTAIALLLLLTSFTVSAQRRTDSLKRLLSQSTADTVRINLLVDLSRNYYLLMPDSGFYFASKALAIAKKSGNAEGEIHALTQVGFSMWLLGNIPEALQTFYSSLHMAERLNDEWSVARNYDGISCIYAENGDMRSAVFYGQKAASIFNRLRDYENEVDELMDIGDFYSSNQLDSSLFYTKKAFDLSTRIHDTNWLPQILTTLGKDYMAQGKKQLALYNFRKSAAMAIKYNEPYNLIGAYQAMAYLFSKSNELDSCLIYTKKVFSISQKGLFSLDRENSAAVLASLYYGKDDHEAAFYYHMASKIRDSLFNDEKQRKVLILNIAEQQHEADLKATQEKFVARIRLYVVIATAAVLLLIGIMLWNNNRKQIKINKLLAEQKEEIASQRDHLGTTIEQLKSTQTQLIQSEKMASLGELTAGIAHEIQNPLNFVNNFSDVNREMLSELREELDKGDIAEAKAIAADIEQNEQKINHHGKRAEAIVKGMLEHSRNSSGQKEPTDINQLSDEYIRLSYHGLRAKDKSFNAELITNFDLAIPKVNAIPQDIGRVLLNLFNNAFYAVNQKAKTAGVDYKPVVSVTTSTENGQVIIKVKDNGIGIPEAIKEKIMQPFFTTKPTGEGTGLGLSLTYDIVVKGHAGSINVKTEEGSYTEFIVKLLV